MTTYHKILSADKTELRRIAVQTAELNQKMYAMLEKLHEHLDDDDTDGLAFDIRELLAEARGGSYE